MKKTFLTTCMLRAAMLLMVLLGTTQGAWSKDFITDVMVIGNNNETEFDKLQSGYEDEGWTAINKDLNASYGDGTDFIHLLYKKQSSPGSSGTPITGFYIKTGSNPPDSLTHEGRTYHLLPCNGSTNFVNNKGDLNRGAGGDYIHLYYTTDPISDYNAVTDIAFNDTQDGAVGKNGDTTGYDLNSGAGGKYIYMHVTVARGPVELTSSTTEVTLLDGDVVFGTGGQETRVKIAAGATVTLSGVDINAIPNTSSYKWVGITCLGDAVIILADGTTNIVKGGRNSSGIFVPEGHTLTIHGNGSLEAKGGENCAGIGSGYQSSCGNITIEGGNITATGGKYGAGIGSGYESSCGNITINAGNITATGGDCAAGIGSGIRGSCGNITFSGGTITAKGGYVGAGIGTGYYGSCGNIVIEGGTITATGSDWAAGIGTGWRGSCGDITIGDNITRIISTMGKNAKTAIGPGNDGKCGTLTIAPSLIDMTAGLTRTLWPGNADLVLYDNADNTTTISTYADSKKHDIQLRGRTLYYDGTWHTLCLPFDLDDFSGTLLEGFIAMELDIETARGGHVTGLDPMAITYHLNFKPVTGIKAGRPYIVRRSTGSSTGTLTNPVFYGVTIKNVAPTTITSTDGAVTFKGSYSPVALGANDHTKLFLGASNVLHHPNANMTVGSCHASFQMAISNKGDVNSDGGISVGDVAAMVNHVMGTDNGTFIVANADLNGDGDINITDVTVLVGMILNESQDLNVVVYTGDTPITYKGGGNGQVN